jgi:regulator of sirC expression with transglutaminase-like and TPR domain
MTDSALPGATAVDAVLDAAGAQPDDRIDIAETALALAALDRPRVALDHYRGHLSDLTCAVAARANDVVDARSRSAILAETLAGEFGYAGDRDTYDDLQNANLMRVIDRRRGLPVALGVLYMHAARAQGWAAVGTRFPGHFLLRIEGLDGSRAVLDPFDGGRALDAPALRSLYKSMAGDDAELDPAFHEPVGDREVLLRLQNNIKTRSIRRGDLRRAARTVRSMLRIAPAHVDAWYELGVIEARGENLMSAIEALGTFVTHSENATARHHAAALIQDLRSRLN